MAEATQKEKIRRLTTEQIQSTYRDGEINAAGRNKLMRMKAQDTLDGVLDAEGPIMAVWTQSVKNFQKGWDDFKDAATREDTGVEDENLVPTLKATALAMWGQVQMLLAIPTAIGEVTGQQVERMALRAGASPGVARVLNIAADIGSGFVLPTGAGVKSAVKGTQALLRGAKVIKAVETAAQASKTQTVLNAVSTALELEGFASAKKALGVVVKSTPEEKAAAKVAAALAPKISVKEQFLADMTKFTADMKSVTATQTHEQTAQLASKLKLSMADLKKLPMFEALSEAEMYGYLKALEPQVGKWQALAKEAVDTGTEQAANAFAEFTSTIFSPLLKFRSSEVTGGRAVEILKTTPPVKSITDVLMEWDPEKIAKGEFIPAMQAMARDVLAAADQPEKLMQLAVKGQSGLWPMARELYLNMLLPFSMVPSFVGNTISNGQHMAERFMGAAFTADKGAGLVGSGIPSYMKGMTLAVGDGLAAFGKAFKRATPEEIGRLDHVPGAIPGMIGHIIRTPTNGTIGMDNFFKTIIRRATYYDMATQEGTRLGLKGKELGEFIERQITWPTKEMLTQGDDVATALTFQNELGAIGKKVRDVLQYGPGTLYFPFMKTGIDLIKYGWNRTPGLQLLSKSLYDDIAAGGVRADEAIGRLTMSQLQSMFVYELAKEGFITGGGPVDPVLRKAWLATHEPYSVQTKNGWVPYTNEDPLTQPVSILADMSQIMDQLDEPSAKQAGLAMAYVVMRDSVNKSWWPAANQLLDIMQGVTRGQPVNKMGEKVLEGPLVTVTTGGAIGGRIKRAVDPVNREARGFYEQVASKLPGFSKTLPPMRDDYGDVVVPAQPVGSSWFGLLSPLWPKYKPKTTDRVKLEGDKLEVKIPSFPDAIGGTARSDFDINEPQPGDRLGTELTTQERDQWKRLYKEQLRHPEQGIEAMLLDNPDYQEQPRAGKRGMFENFLQSSRSIAEQRLQLENPDLGERVLRSDASLILPLIQPQDRPEAQQQIDDAAATFREEAPDALLQFGDFTPDKGGE